MHPPIPTEEFEQPELLAAEKEAIGLFVSAHPLKPLRDALRARVDCPISALAERRDKDWVTIGGIITEAKRIRTRNGDHMMFATLDDLAGAVEILVFGKALAEHEAALAVDEVVIVKGRVDHKEAGKTCVVVQSVERVRALAGGDRAGEHAGARGRAHRHGARAAGARCAIAAADLSASAIEDLRQAIEDIPGHGRGAASRSTRSDGALAGCASARSTACATRRRCAPSSSTRSRALSAAPSAARRGDARRRRKRLSLPSAARGDPALAQRHRERDFLGASAPLRFSPGVSSTHGSLCSAGADRNAAQPSSPSSPAPMLAWRSRLEPSGVCESLRCSERDAPAPELARRTRAARRSCPCGVRMS